MVKSTRICNICLFVTMNRVTLQRTSFLFPLENSFFLTYSVLCKNLSILCFIEQSYKNVINRQVNIRQRIGVFFFHICNKNYRTPTSYARISFSVVFKCLRTDCHLNLSVSPDCTRFHRVYLSIDGYNSANFILYETLAYLTR